MNGVNLWLDEAIYEGIMVFSRRIDQNRKSKSVGNFMPPSLAASRTCLSREGHCLDVCFMLALGQKVMYSKN